MSQTCRCGAPTDLHLCRDCTTRLRTWLADTSDLMDCLDTVIARQNRFGDTATGPAGDTAPLPFDPDAAEARRHLAATLVAVTHTLATRRGVALVLPGVPRLHHHPVWRDHDPDIEPTGNPGYVLPMSRGSVAATAAADWLRIHTDWVRATFDAHDIYHRIERAVTDAERVCVPPAPRWYGGPCDECGHDLLADMDSDGNPRGAYIRCPHCRTQHDLDGRREYLIRQARLRHVTAPTALSWVRMLLDKRIPRGTWDSWVARRRIAARGHDRDGHALFRFGEVEMLARDYIARPRKVRA